MRDLRQMQDDLFAIKMISGEMDREKKDEDASGKKDEPPSGGHYPSGESSGRKPPSGGCLTALILLPVMQLLNLFRNLFF